MSDRIASLERFGYQPGGGLVSPCGGFFLLSIPKNASTYLTNTLVAAGWMHRNAQDCRNRRQIVVLREPTDRWISGIATYITHQLFGWGFGSDHFIEQYTDLTERLIFNRLIFDDHTEPQTTYLQQIPRMDHVLRVGDDLIMGISRITGLEIARIPVEKNQRESNYDLNNLQEFFRQRLGELQPELLRDLEGPYNTAESLLTRLHRVYNSDYQLYKKYQHGTR